MKKNPIFSVLLLVLLAVGLILGSCDNGSTSSSDDAVKGNRTYSGKAGNTYYTLKVSNEARAAGEYTPASGDAYTLTITEGSSTKTSQGTVSSVRIEGGNIVLTLKPSNSSQTFRVTAPENSTTISAITGTIVTTDGTEETPPSVIYPGEQPSTGGGGGSSSGGNGGGGNDPAPTPVTTKATDYKITNLQQVEGAISDVSITPVTAGVGAVESIHYAGVTPDTDLPTDAGSYAVTFKVKATTGFTAETLQAGNLVIVAEGTTLTWVPADATKYTPGTATAAYDGTAKPKTFTVDPAAGAITRTYYNNNATAIDAGTYTVTFDTAEKYPYYAGDKLAGGSFEITKRTPVAGDFEVTSNNLVQVVGTSLTDVTVALKTGKTGAGTITVKYNGNTVRPSAKGTYPITIAVADGTNFAASTGDLALEVDLVVTEPPKTPAKADYQDQIDDWVTTAVDFDGDPHGVAAITAPAAASQGAVTLKYGTLADGVEPEDAGTYAISLIVAPDTGSNYSGATIPSGKSIVINKVTPVAGSMSTYFSGLPNETITMASTDPAPTINISWRAPYNAGTPGIIYVGYRRTPAGGTIQPDHSTTFPTVADGDEVMVIFRYDEGTNNNAVTTYWSISTITVAD